MTVPREKVPPETPPFLHGDGVTDDTDALQWYFDHGIPIPKGKRFLVNWDENLRVPPGFSFGGRAVRDK